MRTAETRQSELRPRRLRPEGPVTRGTRITVEVILRRLAEGATEADLTDAYPRLTSEDIKAAIGYAADTVAHEETIVLERPQSRAKR